jgi:hypothetical protein
MNDTKKIIHKYNKKGAKSIKLASFLHSKNQKDSVK